MVDDMLLVVYNQFEDINFTKTDKTCLMFNNLVQLTTEPSYGQMLAYIFCFLRCTIYSKLTHA